MAGPTDLYDAADEYLGACVDALNALTTAGAPDRAFVSHGPPPLDCCPMLSVHVGNAGIAGTFTDAALGVGHRIVTTGVVETVQLTATIVRCFPAAAAGSGKPHSVAEHEANAARTNADVWAIVNWVIAAKRAERLFAPLHRELSIGVAAARTVEGFCAGWLIPIQVTLDGFTPELST